MNTTATSQPNTLATDDIAIGGMTLCVVRGTGGARAQEGARVTEATVNLATESARVTFDATQANDGRLRRAVRDAGYEPREVAAADAAEPSSWQGFAPVAVGLALSAPAGVANDR